MIVFVLEFLILIHDFLALGVVFVALVLIVPPVAPPGARWAPLALVPRPAVGFVEPGYG